MTKAENPKVEAVCHLIDDPALTQDHHQNSPSPLSLRNMV